MKGIGKQGNNKFLYNQGAGEKTFKTERQPKLGLDMTKFRMYDYALGRFTGIDPLADFSPQESWTPYQYAYNNPVRWNDPYGDCTLCLDALQTGLDVAGLVPGVGKFVEPCYKCFLPVMGCIKWRVPGFDSR